jgi:AdoMet-dependent heme synthase
MTTTARSTAPAALPAPAPDARSGRHGAPVNFDQTPFLVIWEVTRACALACLHCRADAIARRDPRELTTAEAMRLIDQVRAFGDPPPLFVLTGGDPMRRPDLARLVGHAASVGLTVALTPSGTAAVTKARLTELRDAGLQRLAVSLDGPTAEIHDAFRGVRGSHMWTMRIIESATDLGIPLQINSTVGRLTYPHLRAMAACVSDLPIVLWAVFFLIQTGRGASLEQIDAQECEDALCFLHELSGGVAFGIKTTEAPHFHRVRLQRQQGTHASAPAALPARSTHFRAPRSVTDGNGFVFVDHLGQICPSGFLPLVRGSLRSHSLVDVYRDDEVFRRLRDPDALEGKCGWCEFRGICGGSRARAYASTGSPFASDPLCAHVPGGTQPALAGAS